MTVVFVIDTSASMNQRCSNGLSLLDCAKSAVEHFVKLRLRDITWHKSDRYLLVTCEEGVNAIKVVDKYPFVNFTRALKSIEAHDLTEIGTSLQLVLDYLHLHRLVNDTEKYGQGRNPIHIEPTTIILLTDGTELTSKAGVLKTIVPNGPAPAGGELAAKPYRWDQRVFAIVLRMPSVSQQVLERSGPLPQNAPISGSKTALAMDNDISAFCESTGGKCYVATSLKILMQHIEVTSRLSTCVVVSFENMPIPGTTAPPPQVHAACQRKLLLIRANQPHQGHWPIPETFWPDSSQQSLPPREPHPVIVYKAIDSDPSIPAQFIYDKYDIESNPIVNFLTKAAANACWQVFIRNSKGPNFGYGDPFGYLKLIGSNLTLFVLPYNYPVLFHLLEHASKNPKATNTIQWRQEMERYCNSIPAYYGPPLRAALRQWGLNLHVVPDALEKTIFAGFVGNQLKRLKAQAKTELESMTEKLINSSSYAPKPHERVFPSSKSGSIDAPGTHTFTTTAFSVRFSSSSTTSVDSVLSQRTFEVCIPSGPSKPNQNARFTTQASTAEVPKAGNEIANHLGIGSWKDAAVFKNAFDVPRNELFSQLKYLPMRVALAMDARSKNEKAPGNTGSHSALGNLAARMVAMEEEEARHSLPIEKMGDFSDALWKQQPPRNPFADEQERTKQQRSLFGNPYRQEKHDAADEAWFEGSGGAQLRGRKRRRRPESPGLSGSASTSSASSGECSSDASGGEVNSPAKSPKELSDVRDDPDEAGSSSPEAAILSVPHRNPEGGNHEESAAQSEKRRKLLGDASDFVLAALRTLRHAKTNNTHKLFELLSTPDIPVDKASFLEQLIHQARCYKKGGVAAELTDYRTKLLSSQAQAPASA
ncbi:integrator complex subunit 6 homolog [Selaginella moellendorffii]|nr:integrator complex subunit 6 homolog [Selaginella moellendorffii]XP_024514940.1 integrator complex subunit 6 homolog [Selaginella moellendorffii]|eukprot:XP_002985247.2 integrator complex subunit 6 homolog [Selaginella moellendorffii]